MMQKIKLLFIILSLLLLFCFTGNAQSEQSSIHLSLPEDFYNVYSLGSHGLLVLSDDHATLVDQNLKAVWTTEIKINESVETNAHFIQENICYNDSAIFICNQFVIAELDYRGNILVKKTGLIWNYIEKFCMINNQLCMIQSRPNRFLEPGRHFLLYKFDSKTLEQQKPIEIALTNKTGTWELMNENQPGDITLFGGGKNGYILNDDIHIETISIDANANELNDLKFDIAPSNDTVYYPEDYQPDFDVIDYDARSNQYYVFGTYTLKRSIPKGYEMNNPQPVVSDGFMINKYDSTGVLKLRKTYLFKELAKQWPVFKTMQGFPFYELTRYKNGTSLFSFNCKGDRVTFVLDSNLDIRCGVAEKDVPDQNPSKHFGIVNRRLSSALLKMNCSNDLPLIKAYCNARDQVSAKTTIKYTNIMFIGGEPVFVFVHKDKEAGKETVDLISEPIK